MLLVRTRDSTGDSTGDTHPGLTAGVLDTTKSSYRGGVLDAQAAKDWLMHTFIPRCMVLTACPTERHRFSPTDRARLLTTHTILIKNVEFG